MLSHSRQASGDGNPWECWNWRRCSCPWGACGSGHPRGGVDLAAACVIHRALRERESCRGGGIKYEYTVSSYILRRCIVLWKLHFTYTEVTSHGLSKLRLGIYMYTHLHMCMQYMKLVKCPKFKGEWGKECGRVWGEESEERNTIKL